MAFETTATYIDSLVITNPIGASDLPIQADDHLRLIKAALKRTFPSVNGPVTANSAALNQSTVAVRTGTATNISATYSFARDRPRWRYNGVAYTFGGHNGITVDLSGTVMSPALLSWTSQLIGSTYYVGFPDIFDRTRMAIVVTPNQPGVRATVQTSIELLGSGVFTYGFDGAVLSRASVLVSAW